MLPYVWFGLSAVLAPASLAACSIRLHMISADVNLHVRVCLRVDTRSCSSSCSGGGGGSLINRRLMTAGQRRRMTSVGSASGRTAADRSQPRRTSANCMFSLAGDWLFPWSIDRTPNFRHARSASKDPVWTRNDVNRRLVYPLLT